MAYSKAHNEANKRYNQTEAGKAKRKYWNYKTWARTFVKNHAKEADLSMIIKLAQKRLKEIEEAKILELIDKDENYIN